MIHPFLKYLQSFKSYQLKLQISWSKEDISKVPYQNFLHTAQDPGRGPEQFVTVSASAGMCLRAGGVEGVRLCQGHGSPPPRAKRNLTQKPSTLAVRVSTKAPSLGLPQAAMVLSASTKAAWASGRPLGGKKTHPHTSRLEGTSAHPGQGASAVPSRAQGMGWT